IWRKITMRGSFSPTWRMLRVALMLLIPIVLFVGPFQALPHHLLGASDQALAGPPPNLPAAVAIAPPSNLQLLPLDTSIHVTFDPSTDAQTAFHMVSVWEGTQLQQSK